MAEQEIENLNERQDELLFVYVVDNDNIDGIILSNSQNRTLSVYEPRLDGKELKITGKLDYHSEREEVVIYPLEDDGRQRNVKIERIISITKRKYMEILGIRRKYVEESWKNYFSGQSSGNNVIPSLLKLIEQNNN